MHHPPNPRSRLTAQCMFSRVVLNRSGFHEHGENAHPRHGWSTSGTIEEWTDATAGRFICQDVRVCRSDEMNCDFEGEVLEKLADMKTERLRSSGVRLRWRWLHAMQAPTLSRLPERNVRRVFFDRAEFEAVVAYLLEEFQDAARLAFLCGLAQGRRAAEVGYELST